MVRVLIVCLALFYMTATLATNLKQGTKALKQLNHSIAHIKTELSQAELKRQQYQKQLRQSELAVSHALKTLSSTGKKLKHENNTLKSLHQKIEQHVSEINQQQQTVAQQIRETYMLGHPPLLKLILTETSTNKINRMKMYAYYLTKSKAQLIKKLNQTIADLNNLQSKSQHQTRLLSQLHQQQSKQSDQLKRLSTQRKTIVNRINSQIMTKSQRLTVLVNNKRTLEHTLKQLEKEQINVSKRQFNTLKHKLNWPTEGKVDNKFGTKIYQSELRWNGVVISVPEKQAVHAIADGKVVFANWLPGYGLLIIINHGQGYMSLYGRNHNLLTQSGDFVHKGDIIAGAGKSGGYSTTGLYFAIRHNAKPINPAIFCR